MNRLFRSATPGLADYLGLGVVIAAFLALALLLLAPAGSFVSSEPGRVSRALR